MKTLTLSVLCCVVAISMAANCAPKVEVYNNSPFEVGRLTTLICYVSQFQPPIIKVDLLENGLEIPVTNQSDLVFDHKWQYFMTKTAAITPKEKTKYSCRVTHQEKTSTYVLDIDA